DASDYDEGDEDSDDTPRRRHGKTVRIRMTAKDRRAHRHDDYDDDDEDEDDFEDDDKPRRRKGGGRRGGGWGRAISWGVVLCLWGAILAGGMLFWIGAHLPPIHSLEIPKRPPSIQIVGTNGRVLATRGDMGGAAIPLNEVPSYL